ncbi:MAG: 1-deoxy-D-xylulose-5-phosphate synthase, partial [Fusobacteriales bacterium]
EKGINGTIISAACVRPLDEKFLLNSIKGYDNIFILEETYMKNSFGTSILEFLNENGIAKRIYKIALNNAILAHGKRNEILEEEGLKGEKLMKRIEELIYGEKN